MKAVQWVKKLKVSISRKKYIVVAILASFFCDDSRQWGCVFCFGLLRESCEWTDGADLGKEQLIRF